MRLALAFALLASAASAQVPTPRPSPLPQPRLPEVPRLPDPADLARTEREYLEGHPVELRFAVLVVTDGADRVRLEGDRAVRLMHDGADFEGPRRELYAMLTRPGTPVPAEITVPDMLNVLYGYDLVAVTRAGLEERFYLQASR